MGIPVYGTDAGEAQEEDGELTTDWYPFYCQALAAGVKPDEFGDLTFSQIYAIIDASRLAKYNDMYFNVSDIVSNMDDDSVRKSLYGGNTGNPSRGKLVEKMMRPYMPSFMLPEYIDAAKGKVIEGLSPKAAEGVMLAIESKLVSHVNWLQMKPIWHDINATAKKYRP